MNRKQMYHSRDTFLSAGRNVFTHDHTIVLGPVIGRIDTVDFPNTPAHVNPYRFDATYWHESDPQITHTITTASWQEAKRFALTGQR